MAPTVPILAETNEKLEQLQAEIERETGQGVSKNELLDRMVDRAFESKSDLIESFRAE